MEDLKIAMHLELASSCNLERSTISAVCELYKDDVREDKLLLSNGSNQCQMVQTSVMVGLTCGSFKNMKTCKPLLTK